MVRAQEDVQFLLQSLNKSEKTLDSFRVDVFPGRWDNNTAADKAYAFPYPFLRDERARVEG